MIFKIRHVALNALNGTRSTWAGGVLFALCRYVDVSGESAGLWRGFLLEFNEIKKTVFVPEPQRCSPVASTNHRARRPGVPLSGVYAFLTVDISDCRQCVIKYCITEVERDGGSLLKQLWPTLVCK